MEDQEATAGITSPWLDFPQELTCHALITQAVAQHGNQIAVEDDGEHRGSNHPGRLTYYELDQRSDALAQVLVDHGIQLGDVVAIATHRCIAMIVGMIGIQKAGAAFVALDPTHPEDRKRMILDDCKAQAIVTMSGVADDLSTSVTTINLDADGVMEETRCEGTRPSLPVVSSDQVCYLYYTSGSTGKPKGVVVEHRNVVNQLYHFFRQYNLGPASRVLAVTTLTFDPCIVETFYPLSFGATVIIASSPAQKRPDKMIDLLERSKPDLLQATPTMFHLLNSFGWTGSPDVHVLCGGETFPSGLQSMMQNCRSFSNVYGPTETTVWATQMRIDTADEWERLGSSMPAGRPLDNYFVFILDKAMNPVGSGEMGELYIGGAGMTRGYHNRLELNSKAFVTSPLQHLTAPKYAKKAPRHNLIYATGDLFTWTADGLLMYAGRTDSQVKINGHRMELGEIEQTLESHNGVQRAIVMARIDVPGLGRTKVVVAYVQLKVGGDLIDDAEGGEKIKAFAASKLPHYMVPKSVVFIKEWPVNASNKVARQSLPIPAELNSHSRCSTLKKIDGTVLRDIRDTETIVEKLQQCVLQTAGNSVEPDASLLSVGIDSVLVMVFISTISNEFGVSITGKELLSHPTCVSLAPLLLHKISMLQSSSTEPEPDAKMGLMLDNLTGLRGLAVLYVFIYHFSDHFDTFLGIELPSFPYLFTRPLDIETFLILMGCTMMVQNHVNPTQASSFYYKTMIKLFPIYYLGIILSVLLDECLSKSDPYRFKGRFPLLSPWDWVLTLLGLQSWKPAILNAVSGINWFFCCAWQLMLLTPALIRIPQSCSQMNAKVWLLVACVFLDFVIKFGMLMLGPTTGCQWKTGAAGAEGSYAMWYDSVFRRGWAFMVGLSLGNIMVGEVYSGREQDQAAGHAGDELDPGRSTVAFLRGLDWATLTDVTGAMLAFVTWGPDLSADGFRFRDDAQLRLSLSSGPCLFGLRYPLDYDRWFVLPMQQLLLPAFIYCLAHGQGYARHIFSSWPLVFLGTYVWAFYLLHYQVATVFLATYTTGKWTIPTEAATPATPTSPAKNVLQLWGIPCLICSGIVAWATTEYFQPCAQRVAAAVGQACARCGTPEEATSNNVASEATPLLGIRRAA